MLGGLIVFISAGGCMLAERASPPEVLGGAGLLLAAMAWGLAARPGARARDAALAQTAARERLARELHDTVAHHVAAIAVRAQAGQALAARRSEALREALEIAGRGASRPRRASRLRGPPARTVARRARRSGADEPAQPGPPEVQVVLTGALEPALTDAVFRVAREGVANARVHAVDLTRVRVEVTLGAGEVRLTVTDDGARLAAPPASGFGLLGMKERAELQGGACGWSPLPEGGLRVQARFPIRGGS